MRPGRLDRLIFVGPPSYEDRIAILKVKIPSMTADPELDIEGLARMVSWMQRIFGNG
jgi:AAA family ATPase